MLCLPHTTLHADDHDDGDAIYLLICQCSFEYDYHQKALFIFPTALYTLSRFNHSNEIHFHVVNLPIIFL